MRMPYLSAPLILFFFNDTATTEIYTLSLHDALPISRPGPSARSGGLEVGPTEAPSSRWTWSIKRKGCVVAQCEASHVMNAPLPGPRSWPSLGPGSGGYQAIRLSTRIAVTRGGAPP